MSSASQKISVEKAAAASEQHASVVETTLYMTEKKNQGFHGFIKKNQRLGKVRDEFDDGDSTSYPSECSSNERVPDGFEQVGGEDSKEGYSGGKWEEEEKLYYVV